MYLNGKQCMAILDRAERSGRKLPRKLEDALREQAVLAECEAILQDRNPTIPAGKGKWRVL